MFDTASSQRASIEVSVSSAGVVEPLATVEVKSKASGEVLDVLIETGDMVEEGLCDVLASDYYYPAMLAAVDRLDREQRADRVSLWSLVSTGPARAMQLNDRGEIAVGQRADLVLVDWPDGQTPAVQGTWVAGRPAYRARPAH